MPEESDGQIWPEKEYFFAIRVQEDSGISNSFFITPAKNAIEAKNILHEHVMKSSKYKNVKGYTVTNMNRV